MARRYYENEYTRRFPRRRMGQTARGAIPSVPYIPLDLTFRDPRDPRSGTPGILPFPEWDTPPDVRVRPILSLPSKDPSRAEGTPAPGAAPPPPPVSLPGWIYPPINAFHLDEPQNRLPIVVAAGGSLVITLPRVPNGSTGIVNRVGVSTTDTAGTRITSRINTNPVPPLAGIIGAVGDLTRPTLVGPILVRAGEEFSLLLQNTTAGAVTMSARVIGWWWGGQV